MKISFTKKIHWTGLLLVVLGLCGFSDVTLTDIETAVIRQDYREARRLSEELLSRQPDKPTALAASYYLGLSCVQMGQGAEAKKIFKKLEKETEDQNLRDKVYLGLFDAYYMEGHFKKALGIIQKLQHTSVQSEFMSLIYLKLARVNLKLTKWDKARDYLKKIINNYPNSLEVHTARQLLEEKQYFAVQVGAFIDRERAEKLVSELIQKREYAYIVETLDRHSRTFCRVRVGQLSYLGEAEKLRKKLSKQGYPTQIYP